MLKISFLTAFKSTDIWLRSFLCVLCLNKTEFLLNYRKFSSNIMQAVHLSYHIFEHVFLVSFASELMWKIAGFSLNSRLSFGLVLWMTWKQVRAARLEVSFWISSQFLLFLVGGLLNSSQCFLRKSWIKSIIFRYKWIFSIFLEFSWKVFPQKCHKEA